LRVFRLDERFNGEQDEGDRNLDIKKEQQPPRARRGRRNDGGHEALFPSSDGAIFVIAERRLVRKKTDRRNE
jgi:hypothetical protein